MLNAATPIAGQRVLVVDDDLLFSASLRNLLILEGYDVAVAHSEAEARDAVERFDAQVAFLDYRLGPTIGLDLVEPLTRRRPGLLCVLSTAYADIDIAVKALRCGAHDYIRKPVQTDELLATLERCFDRLRLEEEKRAAESALREARKMEALAQIAGGVAHNFNNLLMVMQGNLELLNDCLPEDAERQDLVDNTLRAIDRAAEINRNLVIFTRRQMLRPEPVDLDAFVAEALGELAHELGGSIEIETVARGGLWRVRVDSAQLKAAIAALARNAKEAMPDGGKLMVETANFVSHDAGPAEARGLAPGRYVTLAVSDTGMGMAPEIAARVFEPFFTDKGIAEKVGLGLSMVYGLVKQSGGDVSIESEAGEGTTVKLFIPVIAEESPEREPDANQTTDPSLD